MDHLDNFLDNADDELCPHCHGTGTVIDYVPYGDTWVDRPVRCECQEEQPPNA